MQFTDAQEQQVCTICQAKQGALPAAPHCLVCRQEQSARCVQQQPASRAMTQPKARQSSLLRSTTLRSIQCCPLLETHLQCPLPRWCSPPAQRVQRGVFQPPRGWRRPARRGGPAHEQWQGLIELSTRDAEVCQAAECKTGAKQRAYGCQHTSTALQQALDGPTFTLCSYRTCRTSFPSAPTLYSMLGLSGMKLTALTAPCSPRSVRAQSAVETGSNAMS